MFPSWRWLGEQVRSAGRPRGKRRRPAQARPWLEALEDRILLSFSQPIVSQAGVRPYAIAVGDFNGDGRLDVVTANSISNTVTILLGHGDGTFAAPVDYPVATNPQHVAVGSLRGNGLLDVVTANRGSNASTPGTVSVLLNKSLFQKPGSHLENPWKTRPFPAYGTDSKGDGTFGNASNITVDPGAISVALADLNHDGKLDMVVACTDGYNTFNVDVLLGKGDGTFGPPTRVKSTEWGADGPIDVIVGDFDGDGKPDIVTANAGYSCIFFKGNGDGTFQTGYGNPSNHNNAGVVAADLRGNGILDLVSAGNTYGWVSVMHGNGNGTFQAAQQVGFSGSYSVVAADFRSTGRPDLAVINDSDSGDSMQVFLNDGSGNFSAATENYKIANAPGALAHNLAMGDFNGDGIPDVVVALTQFNEVSVLLASPAASALALSGFPSPVTAGAAGSVTVTLKDAAGNVAAGYRGTVHFTSSDPQAALPADYTFTAADAGKHTFPVALKTAGSQSLTATDKVAGAITGTQAGISVTPAAATRLAVTTQPPGAVAAGAGFGLAVSAEDAYGNVAIPFTGGVAVALANNPGGSTLGGTTTVNAVNGVATFSGLTLDKAGSSYTLQATSSGLSPATTNPFNVANVALSATSVYEFRPVGTVVGTFATGEAGSHTFTYALVSGAGSADNASFTVQGNQLLTADAFDFAARSSYSVRVRSTDEANNAFEQPFTITILDDPALARSGRTLTVSGTPGNDTFAFAAGRVRHAVTLNDTSLAVDTPTVDTIVFQGGGGSDAATLTGIAGGGNTLSLSPGGGSLSGPGYAVRLSGAATVSASGGPGDTATLSDSPGSNSFVATPAYAYLDGPGFYEQASGFQTVVALSTAGGSSSRQAWFCREDCMPRTWVCSGLGHSRITRIAR
jgi:hypothetical protein